MKRKVICFFILVVWVLMICTILSAQVEQQMMVQVTTVVISDLSDMRKLPADTLFYDEKGTHLYEIVRGSGWESGKRVQEISPELYWVEEDGILVTNGSEYGYIQYASKSITSGDLVQTVHSYKGAEEDYLIIDKDEMKNTKLLHMEGQQPYMEMQVKSILAIPEENTVYSLGDVRAFFKNIPLIAILLVIIIISVFIWGYSCILSSKLEENKWLLIGNLIIGGGLLEVFRRVAQVIQLPSSLLPGQNILELGYYRYEFSEIFGALKNLSGAAVEETIKVFQKNMLLAGVEILFGVIVCAAILLLEQRVIKIYRRNLVKRR